MFAVAPRRFRDLAGDEAASSLVEVSLVTPFMLACLLGMVTISAITANYITLANATLAAARQFSVDAPAVVAGSAVSLSATPYSDLQSQLLSRAGLLKSLNTNANLSATGGIVIGSLCIYASSSTCNGGSNVCNSDSTCNTLLASAQDSVVALNTSYPCVAALSFLSLGANCTLHASAVVPVQ